MKKGFTILVALLTWFAVIMQYVLMIQNRTADVAETTIRFFSFFTILTNIIVAIFFTNNIYSKTLNSSKLTAVTIYITIVGLVYQVILRQTWKPEGMQFIVNELLHTLIPLMVIIFWCMYAVNRLTPYSRIAKWAIFSVCFNKGKILWLLSLPFYRCDKPGNGKNVDKRCYDISFVYCHRSYISFYR
jgi:hypothetical protein